MSASMSPGFGSGFGYRTFVQPMAPVGAPAEPANIAHTLQQFLKVTLDGVLDWSHRQQRQANGLLDIFQSSWQGVEIQLQALRPTFLRDWVPDSVRDWVVILTWPERDRKVPRRKVIDGRHLHLPGDVTSTTNLQENTIAKLFRKAYDGAVKGFSAFIPMVEQLTDRLSRQEVEFNFTVVKPDFRYGLLGGKLLQVGGQTPRLEVFQSGHSAPTVTLYPPAQPPVKLSGDAFRNPGLKSAVDRLLQLVSERRTGEPGEGLSAF